MKKALTILVLFAFCLIGNAQRRKAVVKQPERSALERANDAIANYNFRLAINVLEEKIAQEAAKKRNRQSTDREEELLEVARKHELMLSATENVVVIDSLVLPKTEVLKALVLDEESGTLDTYSHHFNKPSNANGTVFINQLCNRMLFSTANADGHMRIYEQELIGTEWKEPSLMNGLVTNEEDDVDFPYLMDDGVTLYFGAQREDGLGGYDIYRTRYDVDDRSFLSAENVGMPFNSPANDYLMVIDEYNSLGYFVTDRGQSVGNVCLYTFIPNTTRRIYQQGELEYEQLCNRARLLCIADTWSNPTDVKTAKERLAELRKTPTKENRQHDFEFVINDKRTYYTLSDFKKAPAREKAKLWVETMKAHSEQNRKLTSLRDQYAKGNTSTKGQLAPQIRLIERSAEQAYLDAKRLEKEIRALELE